MPLLNSAAVAAVFEGLACDLDHARQAVLRGEVRLAPAQDHGVVTPLAAVVSASMLLHEVADGADGGAVAYAPINGGSGPAARLGRCDPAVVEHLRWLNGPFADWLANARPAPVDLLDIADSALAAGDDCHGRTAAATTARLRQLLAPARGSPEALFLERGPSFFLNLWMAACKCMLSAAVDEPGSSLVTAAGANGRETAIQIAGLPGRWFAAPARPPVGDLGTWPPERALGAIGDSALVDLLGFGAMSVAYSPAQMGALGRYLPADGLVRPARLLAVRHPAFRRVVALCGTTAVRVTELGKAPLIALGIRTPPRLEGAGFPVRHVACDVRDPNQVRSLLSEPVDVVFHLAAIMSGAAEREYELGWQVNLDGTRNVLEACRELPTPPKLIFTSTIALYGEDVDEPAADACAIYPRNAYGTQKAIAEMLIAEYSRRGYIDGRMVRISHGAIRSDDAHQGAGAFVTAIVRGPLMGRDTLCPVEPSTRVGFITPRTAFASLLHLAELPAAAFEDRRAIQLPAHTLTVADILDGVRRAGGDTAVARIRFERDAALEKLLAGMPADFEARRARELGFPLTPNIDGSIREYLEDSAKPLIRQSA